MKNYKWKQKNLSKKLNKIDNNMTTEIKKKFIGKKYKKIRQKIM